jgi:hypothetical protein
MRFSLIVASLLSLSFALLSFYDEAFAQNEDEIKIFAQFEPDDSKYTDDTYTIKNFIMNSSNNSQICPSNDCKFQFKDGILRQNTFSSNLYSLSGILRIGTPEGSGDMRYQVYDTKAEFKVYETLEKSNATIHYIDGTINIGDSFNPKFKYQIYTASLTIIDSNIIFKLIAHLMMNY